MVAVAQAWTSAYLKDLVIHPRHQGRILACAPDYLTDNGVLVCEVGNSMVHLMDQYPDIPFTWLEFENGGDGVFMLTRQQLIDCAEHFKAYRD